MKRPRRQTEIVKRRSRDGARQTIAVIAIGAVLAGGLFAAGRYLTAREPLPVAAAAASKVRAPASVGEAIYTGSILYMPDSGRTCRQLLFDNRNGRFTDNGNVDCERAAYRSAAEPPVQWSTARARVIADGFRQH